MTLRLARTLLAVFVLLATGGVAMAASDTDYLDDRTTASAVIHSFYSAINRHEYVRAWSYFLAPPKHQSFEQFEAGYRDTRHVRLATGTEEVEGGVSHYTYSVPVALEAEATNGKRTVYTGCYRLVFTDPSVLALPGQFTSIAITGGKLKKTSLPFSAAMGTCPQS